jgi:Putative Actinobacterial Holin-X, holin superfamily III
MTDSISTPPARGAADASLGELVSRMSEQTSRLVRDELRLAQAEMTAKGKAAGIGIGLFGGAGVIALFGAGCLVATVVLALAIPLDAWLAALIVGIALFAVAGLAALMGKREVSQATPPVPEEAVEGVKQDVHTLKSGSRS